MHVLSKHLSHTFDVFLADPGHLAFPVLLFLGPEIVEPLGAQLGMVLFPLTQDLLQQLQPRLLQPVAATNTELI